MKQYILIYGTVVPIFFNILKYMHEPCSTVAVYIDAYKYIFSNKTETIQYYIALLKHSLLFISTWVYIQN